MVRATAMLSTIIITANRFNVMPPFLKDEKKEGPTCRPMQNTNSVKPNSRRKCRIGVDTVKPKCPIRIPMKRTNVTPSEIPATLILPSKTPAAITKEYRNTMWATEEGSHNKLFNQSIVL